MPTYKYKDCSHEVFFDAYPHECEICGSYRLVILEDSKANRVDEELLPIIEFHSTIQNYCEQIGWKVSDINQDRAILRFDMESGSVQPLYVFRYKNTLEFSCPSFLKFPVDDDLRLFRDHYARARIFNEFTRLSAF